MAAGLVDSAKRVLLCAHQVSEDIIRYAQFLCRQWWRNSEMMLHDCFYGRRLHEESTLPQ